jgi:hypothetical protein
MYRTFLTRTSAISKTTIKPIFTNQTIRPLSNTSSKMASQQNQQGQGVSHAKDSSVPEAVQRQAPKKLEDELPDSVHNTNSNKDTGKVSHAKGDSVVPQALQEALPESVEKAVPDFIHDTTGKTKQ